MDPIVVTVILASAVMHAVWNAMVKGGADGLVVQTAVVCGGALLAVPFLFLVPFPPPEVWWYLVASALIHGLYFWVLAAAYQFGDLSLVYPVARGSGPLLIAGLSAVFLREYLSAGQMAGIGLICAGLFVLTLSGRHGGGSRAILYALLVALTIAGYTIFDGIGVRTAETPYSYIAWLIAIQSLPILALAWWLRGRDFPALARAEWRSGAMGGLLIGLSYGMAMWAFAQEALALVMALRETAVIFGALIGAIVFKEAFGRWRILASILVAAGAVTINVVN